MNVTSAFMSRCTDHHRLTPIHTLVPPPAHYPRRAHSHGAPPLLCRGALSPNNPATLSCRPVRTVYLFQVLAFIHMQPSVPLQQYG